MNVLSDVAALKAGLILLAWGLGLLGVTQLVVSKTKTSPTIGQGLKRGALVSAGMGICLLVYALAARPGTDPEILKYVLMIGLPLAVIGITRLFRSDLSSLGRRRRP